MHRCWNASGCTKGHSYLVSVYVVEAIQQHLHDLFDLRQGELHMGIAEQARQVVFTEVKYQVDAALVSIKLSGYSEQEKGEGGECFLENKEFTSNLLARQ